MLKENFIKFISVYSSFSIDIKRVKSLFFYLPALDIILMFLKKYLIAFLFIGVVSTYSSISLAQCSSPVIYSSTGNSEFFVPAGVTSITIDVWGGGGGGGGRTTAGGSGGGGGGAFSRSIIAVSPGETYTVFVGAGGASNQNGQDSWVSTTASIDDAIVLAKGGLSPGNNNATGALGGSAADGIFNDVGYNGGNGGNGDSSPAGSRRGGGGGGAAGPGGPGGNGTGGTGGSNGNGGGDGGTAAPAGNSNANGVAGSVIGGGGSGAKRRNANGAGGVGAQGTVIITYTCPPIPDGDLITDGATDGYTIIAFNANGTWTPPLGLEEFEVLVVGGGGGGGRGNAAGGGGAGGVRRVLFQDINGGTGFLGTEVFNIEVGNGGTGSNNLNQRGGSGQPSRFDQGGTYEVISTGGGGGGSNNNQRPGGNGASGGGGAGNTAGSGAGGIGSNGNNGGNGNSLLFSAAGGGGGGAGSAGLSGSFLFLVFPFGGDGGNGVFTTGFPGTYGGGGGGNSTGLIGLGGSGIGGNANNSGIGGAGAVNTGSGGGAGTTQGGNGGSGRIVIRYPNFKILPVEYLYFDANFKRQERLVELRWATGKEWENSHFEVERAVNQVRNWETIGRVEGVGFSDAQVSYEFKDKQVPLVGGNVFYRLKQVDFDGTFAYSKVVSARVPGIEVTNGVWRAFPNPTDGQNFRVSLIDRSQYEEEAITFRLVHPMIFTPPQTVASETEMNARIEELVRKMPKGVFVVEIQWGRKVEHIKVLKQ